MGIHLGKRVNMRQIMALVFAFAIIANQLPGAAEEGSNVPTPTHWAFKPVRRPRIEPDGNDKSASPIDSLVAARLRENGLKPSREADRRTLIRRLSFDLLGLPPTPEQASAFVADKDPSAYEKL